MRILFLILTFLFSLNSFSQKKKLPIKVIDATVQFWQSPAPGGRNGWSYTIKIFINTAQKIDFTSVWLKERNAPFSIEFFSQEIQKQIRQNDSVLLTYTTVNGVEENYPEAKRVPLSYKGDALIEAIIDGKTRYFIVKKFRTLPLPKKDVK